MEAIQCGTYPSRPSVQVVVAVVTSSWSQKELKKKQGNELNSIHVDYSKSPSQSLPSNARHVGTSMGVSSGWRYCSGDLSAVGIQRCHRFVALLRQTSRVIVAILVCLRRITAFVCKGRVMLSFVLSFVGQVWVEGKGELETSCRTRTTDMNRIAHDLPRSHAGACNVPPPRGCGQGNRAKCTPP